MEYQYITENNLENRQKYNYSQFGGDEFLESYLKSRRETILLLSASKAKHNTYCELKLISDSLKENDEATMTHKEYIDKYLKSFEVRKRLYSFYDENWKPATEVYDDYINYILFSEILGIMYQRLHNLKYLNCLLKVNDTIISLIAYMPESIKINVKGLLEKELILYETISL